jgi:hypothetical protein
MSSVDYRKTTSVDTLNLLMFSATFPPISLGLLYILSPVASLIQGLRWAHVATTLTELQ